MSNYSGNSISNYIYPIAAAGIASAVFAGCGGGGHNGAPDITMPTPTPTVEHEHHATKTVRIESASPAQIDASYDAAYNFMIDFDVDELTGPVRLPSKIKVEKVRRQTRKAAELAIAADAVFDSEDWPLEDEVAEEVSYIKDDNIKAAAVKGIIKNVYADILYDLTNGPNDEDKNSQIAFLQHSLAGNPDEYVALKSKIDALTKVALEREALTNSDDSDQWAKDDDKLNSAWAAADTEATGYWADLDGKSALALGKIYDNSPKSKKIQKEGDEDYKEYLHHCDGLASPALDKCAADEAVNDANGGYTDLFEMWAPKVTDPTQRARVEAAATDQAIDDIETGYSDLAEDWIKYVHNPADRARLDKAYLEAAKQDYKEGYSDLGDDLANHIADPQIKAEALKNKQQ